MTMTDTDALKAADLQALLRKIYAAHGFKHTDLTFASKHALQRLYLIKREGNRFVAKALSRAAPVVEADEGCVTGRVFEPYPGAFDHILGPEEASPTDRAQVDALMAALGNAFVTSVSEGHPESIERRYRLIFSFPSMEALHKAHDAWVNRGDTPPPTDRAQADAVREALERLLAYVDLVARTRGWIDHGERKAAHAALAQPGPVEDGV